MDTFLAKLPFRNKPLVVALQRIAPLAGSAVATPQDASDLDFFILRNDEMAFFEMVHLILPFATHFQQQQSSDYPDEWTLLTFRLRNETMEIQLILTKAESPHDVLASFDMDYVQCLLYQDQFLITPNAQLALEHKRVFVIRNHDRTIRFQKALMKKMCLPVFFNRLRIQPKTEFQTISELQCKNIKLQPFMERKVDVINTQELNIVGFVPRHKDKKIYYDFVLKTKDGKTVHSRYVALRCTILNLLNPPGAYRSVVQLANMERKEWLKIRCNDSLTIECNKPQILIFELSSAIESHGRFYLDIVQVWDDTPYLQDMCWCELLLAMELATNTDTRVLSDDAISKLITLNEQKYQTSEAKNSNQEQLNHICAQVFAALLYYRTENKPNPFAFVARQLLWDLDKHFNDKLAKDLLYLQNFNQVSSLGMLTNFVQTHYKRVSQQLQS